MSNPFRFIGGVVALSLGLACLPFVSAAKFHSAEPLPHAQFQADEEKSLRALVEKYFALYAAKDVEGVFSLWSAQAPEYATLKSNWQRQFATADYRANLPAISRLKVEGEKASLRAMVTLTTTDLKSKQQRERQIARNFDLLSEKGVWKVWRVSPAENDLAEALMKVQTEAGRAALLAQEQELVTSELVRALVEQGDRWRNKADYPQALASYRLAQSIAEQIRDQLGIATTWYTIGLVLDSQGNYAQALDHYQQSLALFESLGNQAGIAQNLNAMASVHWSQGNYAQALESYQKCLSIHEALDNKTGIAYALGNLGSLHYSLGNYAQAMDYNQQTLARLEALGEKRYLPGVLNNMAIVYDAQGNYAHAIKRGLKSTLRSQTKVRATATFANANLATRFQPKACRSHRARQHASAAADCPPGFSTTAARDSW
jgi:tetratricopeptide (TPR) repeat protein